MIVLIVGIDMVICRPVLAWVQRFRLEEVPGGQPQEPLMQIVFRHSRIIRWVKLMYRRTLLRRRLRTPQSSLISSTLATLAPILPAAVLPDPRPETEQIPRREDRVSVGSGVARVLRSRAFANALLALMTAFFLFVFWKLLRLLSVVTLSTWIILLRNTFWTFSRVVAAILVSTIWTVPAGIWMAMSARRVRFFQPIIQVMASFPAPMLYPLAILLFFKLGFNFQIIAGLLMFLGVQWYILFNVLAGALRIPLELKYSLDLMEASRWDVWRVLYLPSVFPALVTGWVTAAGGAWNASILAEYIKLQGHLLQTAGLGASISAATEAGDFPVMAASLTLMVVVVVVLNRGLWAKLYRSAQTRFRMDLA